MSHIININSPLGTILSEKTEKITKRNHIRVYRKFLKEVLFYRRGSRSQGVAGNQLGMDKSIFTAKRDFRGRSGRVRAGGGGFLLPILVIGPARIC